LSDSATLDQSAKAAHSVKKRSSRPTSSPLLPDRSSTPPKQAMACAATWLAAASTTESAGTMPSPLNFVCANILAVSVTSPSEIEVESALPRSRRICLAEEKSCLPETVAVLICARGSASPPLFRAPRSLRWSSHHCTAAMTSGARTRPSWSASINAKVRSSYSKPLAGQASAAQSF
jgi:hypothetical protein